MPLARSSTHCSVGGSPSMRRTILAAASTCRPRSMLTRTPTWPGHSPTCTSSASGYCATARWMLFAASMTRGLARAEWAVRTAAEAAAAAVARWRTNRQSIGTGLPRSTIDNRRSFTHGKRKRGVWVDCGDLESSPHTLASRPPSRSVLGFRRIAVSSRPSTQTRAGRQQCGQEQPPQLRCRRHGGRAE